MDGHGDAGQNELLPALVLRILGPLEAWLGDKQVPLGGQRQRSVLACLLLEPGRAVSSDRIADAVWDGHPPAGVQTTLQTYVFHLREALEPTRVKGAASGVISTVPGGYRLEKTAATVDAVRFEELVAAARSSLAADPATASALLKQALELWRGDVLADLTSMDAFVAPVAARLEETRAAATELWVEAEMELGHDVLGTLDDLAARYPLREHLAAARMLALYRAGRQADALAAYRTLRQTLDDELGIQPSAEVESLNRRVLQQDPNLDLVMPVTPDETVPKAPPPEPNAAAGGRLVGLSWSHGASRRRQWVAVSVVGALAASLLVWIVVKAARSDDVTPVPPNTLAMLSEHGLDGDPLPVGITPGALASGGGALWVADEGNDAVLRVDPENHRVVQTIPGVGGGPQSVATTQGDVWVAGAREGVVARVNATTNRVVDKIVVGVQPAAVVATPEQVWVANSADNTVQRIDPTTDKADQPIRVGDGPDGLLLDGSTLWVANSRSGSVTRVDTQTGERLAADLRVDVGARGMAMTDSDVWVANELGQSVSRIDRTSGRVMTIPVEDGPSTVVLSDGSAWVNNAYSGTVSRIDIDTNRVSRINLGSAPRALGLIDGRVWVSTGAFGSPEHQGGTLVYTEYRPDPGTLDPARIGAPSRIAILRHVYDGLLSFRVTGGRGAEALVPDLAASLPTPTDGGLTYTFTIRPGIRYSTGAEVRASDFIIGLRRALADSDASNPFNKVVGATQCMADASVPGNCDLRGGADADDATRRLTIRLTEPDPDFFPKLAYAVVPTPAGAPLENVGLSAAIPGTGPYLISDIEPNGNFALSRNPYFAPWSFAAQPAAYPDRVEFRIAPSRDQAAADVISGVADVTTITVAEGAQLGGHAELVHEFENYNTDWAYLNARIPPFDNLKARQALNYAVDRRTFVSLYGGGDSGANLSCQLLPRGFSSWRPYCPYQTGAATERYLGPDLARARDLVRESGTAAVPITVHAYREYPLWEAFPAYLVEVLRSIGYTDVTMVDIPPEHNTGPEDPAYAGYQIFTQAGWLADYPSASNFYARFSCQGTNFSGYCNPAIEAVAVQAAATAQTDPTRSLDLWAKVDHLLTDDAAFVTLGGHHDAALVSPRVSNVLTRPGLGAVLSQLWVR